MKTIALNAHAYTQNPTDLISRPLVRSQINFNQPPSRRSSNFTVRRVGHETFDASTLSSFIKMRRVNLANPTHSEQSDPDNSRTIDNSQVMSELQKSLKLPNHVQVIKKIGSGSFSTVFLVRHTLLSYDFAFKKNNMNTIHEKIEIAVNRSMDHPFIAAFYGSSENSGNLMIEYIRGNSLLELVNLKKPPEEFAKKIICQILSAIHYMHKQLNITHRDLKLENIIIDERGNSRLIDFGLSKMTQNANSVMYTYCGSMQYSAPEIVSRKPYDHKVDMWSIGIILYALIYHKLPFTSNNCPDLVDMILNNDPEFPPTTTISPQGNHIVNVSEDCIDMMKNLLSKNSETRFDFKQIKEHPWVTKSKYSQYLKKSFYLDPSIQILPFENDKIALDPEVLTQLASFGYEIPEVEKSINEFKDNELTMTYRICRHQLIEKKLNERRLLITDDSLTSTRYKPLKMSKSVNIKMSEFSFSEITNTQNKLRDTIRNNIFMGQRAISNISSPQSLKSCSLAGMINDLNIKFKCRKSDNSVSPLLMNPNEKK